MISTFWGIVLGTFVLEDIAIASSLALVQQGQISMGLAGFACFFGISLGDIILFLLGRGASRFDFIRSWSLIKKAQRYFSHEEQRQKLATAIVVSRAIPGTRLPTYIGAGMLNYSFPSFVGLTLISVAIWVLATFAGGRLLLGQGQWHWSLIVLGLLILMATLRRLFILGTDPWARKAWKSSWLKWRSFEFWPAWLFYLPMIPHYLKWSFKTRSLITPFYANPKILNGGIVGESKWDFLQDLPLAASYTLKSCKMVAPVTLEAVKAEVQKLGLHFPWILKPDVGQRGFAVRWVKSWEDVEEYLAQSHFDLIVQEKSKYAREAGVFYIKYPGKLRGEIFSITDKAFPTVVGDGVTTLGELILKDKRARIIAPIYFERHKVELDRVLRPGEVFALSECGNHCQGAIFYNGKNLMTPTLLEAMEDVVAHLPDFYFGRIDLRYESAEMLKEGRNFQIVEINGAGSEATHIWDASTTLSEAYQTLYQQWEHLFLIGQAVRDENIEAKVSTKAFLRDFFSQILRKEKLSVSS